MKMTKIQYPSKRDREKYYAGSVHELKSKTIINADDQSFHTFQNGWNYQKKAIQVQTFSILS